jgi:hypothetical protein
MDLVDLGGTSTVDRGVQVEMPGAARIGERLLDGSIVLVDLEDLSPYQSIALIDPPTDLFDLPLSLFAVVQVLLDLSDHVAKS